MEIQKIVVWFQAGAGIFSVLQCIQTGCHVYPDTCSLCNVSAFPEIPGPGGGWWSLTTRLHPVRSLGILNTPQFMCLLLSTEIILRTFTFKSAHYLSLFSVEWWNN